jgi:DNA-binding GntR family transcriptional regulator
MEQIRLGEWKPGEKIPTEEEIQQTFDVSRTTVRQAMREIELEGKITRQPGRGTFVTQPKFMEGPNAFELELLEFNKKGMQVSWQVIQAGEVSAPEKVAEWLQISQATRVFVCSGCVMPMNLSSGIRIRTLPQSTSTRLICLWQKRLHHVLPEPH